MDRSKLYRRFRTLLIANRGEIACRVIRSARAMGLRTVAVYSEADREAMHVALADEAVLLGPARARDSYLNIERVIAAAKQTGAEAVHPGYGFLSENRRFAERLAEHGIRLIGPRPEHLDAFGLKHKAREIAERSGVPLLPGSGLLETIDEAVCEAERIGFPVMLKSTAGGGGIGMQLCHDVATLRERFASVQRTARASFGDARVYLERFVARARHIEVQIIGDSHGNLLSLWERECTLQRRHQKVIEEAPSPTLNAAQRETVCEAARKAAGAVNYVGAGTIEFVSDGKDVFFIEMNTRLQVEHPVTELITGVDLVEWQLRVAFGEALPLKQNEIRLNGHAIEARVYAENPQKNFMPSVGRIKTWRTPPDGDGLRIDAGYRSGDNVSPYYDAMLAKVIAWAPTREGAIEKLNRGLEQTDVRGIVTNIPFLSALVTHQATRTNAIDTGFIERELKNLTAGQGAAGDFELCAAVAAIVDDEQKAARREANSPWQAFGWMPVGRRQRVFSFKQGHEPPQTITLHYGNGPSTLSVGGHELAFAISSSGEDGFDLTLNGLKSRVASVIEGHELYLRTRNGRFDLHWVDPFGGESEEQVGEDKIVAPLPGTVVALLAEEGATLEKGAPILTLEVMKMEQTLRAPYAGVLKKLKCKVGDIVGEGVELAEVEPAAAS